MNYNEIIKTDDYKIFIQDIKSRIQSAQIKASVAVNQELLLLYWYIGDRIVSKQKSLLGVMAFYDK